LNSFRYVTAASAASARELAGERGRYLAGGIDLLGEMKETIAQPEVLVNIKALPGLNKIEVGERTWKIGANVTVTQLEDHAGLKANFAGLQQAADRLNHRERRREEQHHRHALGHPHHDADDRGAQSNPLAASGGLVKKIQD